MVEIDGERLLADLKKLRTFGACGTGVVRTALSEVDMAARRWLCERMQAAGLEASIDGVGNVIGRSPKPGPALLIGSHSDTQPRGGWLDGALGVIYGLEVARALAESPETDSLAVDVASWMDEEGTYLGFLGSRSFCEDLRDEVVAEARNYQGHRLLDALEAAGLAGVARITLEPDRYCGYLEAHIEQGPYLEAEGKRIGVVTAIIGMRDHVIAFKGVQNHAGTTPMPLRKDAGRTLVELAHRVHEEFPRIAGPRTVWTIGRIELDPGSPSIIPGQARMWLQFRDPEDARLDALEEHARALVEASNRAGPCEVSMTPLRDAVKPAVMDAELQKHLAAAAEQHAPGAWMSMPSGAGHDAQVLATRLPAGMLFVPSIGGVSHDFAEDTAEADIVLGCRVLATGAARALGAARKGG